MEKQKSRKQRLLIGLVAGILVGLSLFCPGLWQAKATVRQISAENIIDFGAADQNGLFLDLTDVDYMPSSTVAYDVIRKNQTSSGAKISLRFDDEVRTFNKGIWAHATSNLDYDLRNYQDYDYLTAYVGVDSKATATVGSVKFCVYTSTSATAPTTVAEWGQVLTEADGATNCTQVARPTDNATFVKIPIKGVNYIRFHANSNGSNASDHAVYGDIKLVKEGYKEDSGVIPEVGELDAQLKAEDGAAADLIERSPDYEMTLLRRNLAQKASRWTLTQFVQQGQEEREMMAWLYNDLGALRMYTTGGAPTGSYEQSLAVLTELYTEYKDDLSDSTPLQYGSGTRGELYQKMMISIALTHSKQVRFWIRDQGAMAGNAESPNVSRPLDRYAVYKGMYLNGKLQTAVFEQLEVEEMRYVMFTELGDDEIEWLRDWLPTVGKGLYTYPPVPYISIGNHYWFDQNYDESYIDPKSGKTWAERYHLIGANYTDGIDKSIAGNYKIGFEAKAPHLWMINYYGGVCWQISNFGQNMTASYGVPSTTFGQPGHLAFANYEMGNGTPAWALTNDVSGWSQSNFTGYTNINTYHPVRQMNNWGAATGEYSLLRNRYGQQGSYVTMAQAAINDFENYEKSQIIVKLAEIYSDNLGKQEEVYREALTAQDFNFDAWYGIIANYISQGNKTAKDWYDLASMMTESRMKSFALPYHDLMQTIIAQMPANSEADSVTTGYSLSTEMMLRRTLEWMVDSKNASEIDIAGIFRQSGVTRTLANALLGRLNNQVAVFSFDGDDAGVLKLGSKYENSNAAFDYSLDGGETWSSGPNHDKWVTEKRIKLTDEEIAKINIDDDIKVHIQGVPWTEANYYTIDIKKGTLPANLYANDKENRVVGVNTTMEWREVKIGDDGARTEGEWVSYAKESPLRIGDITIQVRVGATGVFLPSDASADYKFTADTDPDTRKYIPVSHLSVAAVSSQATGGGQYGNAIYAIDGNINTRWHSNWQGNDHDQWIVIKLDHLTDLSALGYVPSGGGNGRILQGKIYVTTDENPDLSSFSAIEQGFQHVGTISDDCVETEQLLCAGNWDNRDNGISNGQPNPRTFEFRRTKEVPKLSEEGEPVLDENGEAVKEEIVTHEAIPARYVAIKATLTSNNNNFIAARMLNFYEDKTKNPRPTAGIAYSTIEPTNGDVIARLVNTTEEEIEVVDENGNVMGEGGFQHIFRENGTYTFRFRKVGDPNPDNIGTAIAKVDWIMRKIPVPTITYVCVDDNVMDNSNQTEDCSRENGRTNRSVSVKLTFPDNTQIRILNNGYQEESGDEGYDTEAPDPVPGDGDDKNDDGMSKDENSLDPFSYLFMRNGQFTFRYEDAAGNTGSSTVMVDWIDKSAPKVNIEYSTIEETTGEVVATISKVMAPEGGMGDNDDSPEINEDFVLLPDGIHDENGLEYNEDFIVTNNGGKKEYRFTRNGEFIFEYQDEAGNKGSVVAKVDWIKEVEQPDTPDVPEVPDNPDSNKPGVDQPNDDQTSGDQQPDPGVTVPGQNNGGNNGNNNSSEGNNSNSSNSNTGSNIGGSNGPSSSTVTDVVGLPEGVKPQNKPLVLDDKLKDKFGSNSEYFELDFVDENGESVTERPEEVKFKLPAGKKLIGVYLVKDDGTTEPVEYEITEDGQVVIKNPKSGKYLFDYEDPKVDNPVKEEEKKDEASKEKQEWYQNPVLLWGLGGAAVILVVGIGAAMVNNRRR